MINRYELHHLVNLFFNCLLLLCCGIANATPVDVRIEGGLNAQQYAYLKSATARVLSKLPADFLKDLFPDNILIIEAARLNKNLSPSSLCRAENKVFGEISRNRRKLRISSTLVELATTSGEQELACLHGSYAAAVQATLIHELAHFYDARHEMSRDKQFRGMIVARKGRNVGRPLRNYNASNSPDAYEFTSAKEAFAVNFEYYVLDEDYRCARPALAAFLDAQFNKVVTSNCGQSSYVLVHSHVLSDNLARMASVDPDSIYAVHYLHAADGTNMASRWGHAMFRLVTCAPHREAVNEDCLADAAHHLVLSYRAHVVDFGVNYLRGLWGAYPSQLFVYGLPEIIKEYTRHEFRDLISIPLNLTETEQSTFLALVLERYWNYRGKYYFISNHCGTESLRHLNASLEEPKEPLAALTPRGLLRKLGKTRLVDDATYNEIRYATVPGYNFFPSREADYKAAFGSLKLVGLYADQSFKKFLRRNNAITREAGYKDFFAASTYQALTTANQQKIVREMLFLERLLQSKEKSKLSEEIVRLLSKNDTKAIETLRNQVRTLRAPVWVLVEDGRYGVPEEAAIRNYLDERGARTGLIDDVQSIIRSQASVQRVLDKLKQLRRLELMLQEEMRD